MFDRLDLTRVVELACGHGRHVPMYQDRAGEIVLMDILPENIDWCRQRFADPRITALTNDGTDFRPLADESVTAIFSYDSMVHFPPDVVGSYIADAARVLVPGGRALFHHSNYSAPADRHYGLNPHARNHMDQALFRDLVGDHLRIEESVIVPWGQVADLDCATMLVKP